MEKSYGLKGLGLILFLVFLSSCSFGSSVSFDSGAVFDVEVANTDATRAKGLMNVSSMPQDEGMLFVFDNLKARGFWMKNTLIPLDMIFIDADGKVVQVIENVPICEKDPCPVYRSRPAKYVLEINAGIAAKSKIVTGVQSTIKSAN